MNTRGDVTQTMVSRRNAIEGDDRSPAGLDDSWFEWPRTPLRSPPPERRPPPLGDRLADGWFV
jgi:hypothetical protein